MTPAEEILAGLEQAGIRLGLDHLRAVVEDLGHPERSCPSILVAGTNGKGSVSALLASIARAAGLRTGFYSSPHLERVEERIRLLGDPISNERLGSALRRVLGVARSRGHQGLTYFEAMTLSAFLAFADESLDLAVLEVGMGGRLDATNLVDTRLAVVTPIAFDHQEWLGSTLGAIAREKAGIFRSGQTAILAPQEPEAAAALLEAGAARGVHTVPAEQAVRRLEVHFRGLDGLDLDLETESHSYRLATPLAGRHQAWNVATAVAAAERFGECGLQAPSRMQIEAGVRTCRWPGRLEALAAPSGPSVVLLDAAHNPAGCAALASFLDELDRPFTLLFGALADKELAGMLPPLAKRARRVVLTRPLSTRAADPDRLRDFVPTETPLAVEPESGKALALALRDAPDLVVACGSIFLIGALRGSLRERTV